MGTLRKMKRNIDKQNNAFLQKHEKELPADWRLRPQADRNLLAMMARNGITQEDMKREMLRVKNETYELTSVATLKMAYAAMSIVLSEEYGYSQEDCLKILKAVDQKVGMAIDNEEVLNEMETKVGLRFNHTEALERIEAI